LILHAHPGFRLPTFPRSGHNYQVSSAVVSQIVCVHGPDSHISELGYIFRGPGFDTASMPPGARDTAVTSQPVMEDALVVSIVQSVVPANLLSKHSNRRACHFMSLDILPDSSSLDHRRKCTQHTLVNLLQGCKFNARIGCGAPMRASILWRGSKSVLRMLTFSHNPAMPQAMPQSCHASSQ
jgi:hypothetical protein